VIHENEDFVTPGAGATMTLLKLYPDMKHDGYTPADVVVYLRDHQETLFDIDDTHRPVIHQFLKPHDKDKMFTDRLTTFGCEVTCCQFSVYERFLNNPALIDRRKQPFKLNSTKPLLEF
jgi:hypothetical protein